MSEPLTPEELAAIKARCAAATPGPWYVQREDGEFGSIDHTIAGSDGGDVARVEEFARPDERSPTRADAAFIAHARTDIERLVAEVEQLRAVLRENCFGHVDDCDCIGCRWILEGRL